MKIGIDGPHLNLKKAIYNKITANDILERKNKAFFLIWGTKQGSPCSPLLFNIVLKGLGLTVVSYVSPYRARKGCAGRLKYMYLEGWRIYAGSQVTLPKVKVLTGVEETEASLPFFFPFYSIQATSLFVGATHTQSESFVPMLSQGAYL